jgi:branched-chain amino acid transport system permease protein
LLFEFALMGGILTGIFYGFLAVGLNLVFGVLRIVNLAHGAVVVLGAYLAWELATALHWNPLIAMLVAVPPSILIGIVVYYGVAPRLSKAADPEMLSLILFFGVSEALEAISTIGFTSNRRSLPETTLGGLSITIFGQRYPFSWGIGAAVAIPVFVLLYFYLYRSRLGLATRAVMSSPDDAASVGIDVKRTSAICLGVGLLLAAAAGAISIFIRGGTDPAQGIALTTLAFAVIVIGGLGNPMGTLAGGLVFGIAYSFSQTYAPSWSGLIPYVLLLVVMLARPTGLFGGKVRAA